MVVAVEQGIKVAKGVPLSKQVLHYLIKFIREPTESEIFAAAQQAQDTYRRVVQERIEASCSRVRSPQEVVLSQPTPPVRRSQRVKPAQMNRPTSKEPGPLTADIYQLINYYQDEYRAQHGKSGDFSGNPDFVSALFQRYLSTF